MTSREYDVMFDGRPIFEIIQDDAPVPEEERLEHEFFVFVMGPYTAFDARHVFSDGGELESPFIEDPLFDPDRHLTPDGRGSYKMALEDLCDDLSRRFGVRAFLATDINIPTSEEVAPDQPSMPVLAQSIAYSAVSDAVVFMFTNAGLTAGVAEEVGAVLARFNLHVHDPDTPQKPRERFRIFQHVEFRSATIEDIPSDFRVDVATFAERENLIGKIQHFLSNIERDDPDRVLPIYSPDGI